MPCLAKSISVVVPPYCRGPAAREKIVAGGGTAGKAFQMRVGVHPARNDHAATGIEHFCVTVRDVAGNFGNSAIDDEKISVIVVHCRDDTTIFDERPHVSVSPDNAAAAPQTPEAI